jgi:hypothetical protein
MLRIPIPNPTVVIWHDHEEGLEYTTFSEEMHRGSGDSVDKQVGISPR